MHNFSNEGDHIGMNTLKISVALLAAVAANFLPIYTHSAPTDNPVASFYDGSEGYPAWTDRVKWANAIDMKAYDKGKNDFEKFEAARDELAAKGGGVLYYPAGIYDFKDAPSDGPSGRGLMLRSGVVIRGEKPEGKPLAVKDGKLDLKTRFVFGMQKKSVAVGESTRDVFVPRDWNIVGLMVEPGKDISSIENVGICWVNMSGAAVFFGLGLTWSNTWKTARSWKSAYAKGAWADRKPDGTHPADGFMGAPGPKDGGNYTGSGRGRLTRRET